MAFIIEEAERRPRGKMSAFALALLAALVLLGIFLFGLLPRTDAAHASSVVFEIQKGEGFRDIVLDLRNRELIRSATAFEAYSFLGGRALEMRPGLYRLSASMSVPEIVKTIAAGNAGEVTITIPEGSNVFDVDRILSSALVVRPGAIIAANKTGHFEGALFPDTYNFFTNTAADQVIGTLMKNFQAKAEPILAADKKNEARNIIVASIVEKEVPDPGDQEIVAGIIAKRIAAGMPLDVDATVCYAKFLKNPSSTASCYPLSSLDFKIDSPYNTYLNDGLPPGPIGNPGISAIQAALHPKSSPYWYYLSDPKTGKTIFAKTLDEQNQNRVKYLVR